MKWWQRLWHRKQMDEELEKELRFHLDQHTNDLIAQGHDPVEARRQARLNLGGPDQVKEECRDARGTRWFEDLAQDFRYAIRTLRNRPGFAAVALLTLALGAGATTVMFTVINGVLLKPLAYPEPGRLLTLEQQTDKGGSGDFNYLDFLDCKREGRPAAVMAAWRFSGGTVSGQGEAEYVTGGQISAELFAVLGIPLFQGRAFLPDEDRPGAAPVMILSYELWQRRFAGNPGAIGTQLVFDGKPYTIAGIAPAGFRLAGEADVFTPIGQNTERNMQHRFSQPIAVFARLETGVTLAQAQ